jgi:hypothetical protein
MDGQAGRGGERILRRIIALLVSLAVLAERAAERSLPVRWLVLWILRRAETVVEDFVFDETGMPPPAMEGFAPIGNGPDDALALAARFKALAAALCALLPLACPFDRHRRRRGVAFGHFAPGRGCPSGGWTPRPYDTS